MPASCATNEMGSTVQDHDDANADPRIRSFLHSLDQLVVGRFKIECERRITYPPLHMNTDIHFQDIAMLQH